MLIRQPDLPSISHVFTISYVAEKLAEDEEWIWELQINMFPEDGCLRVYGVGEDGVPAFTDYGIEVPKAHHRRRKGGRKSGAANPIEEIGQLRCSPLTKPPRSFPPAVGGSRPS